MRKASGILVVLMSLALISPALADQRPTYSGPLSPQEKAFVRAIQADLMQRFPKASDAEKAGYVRYTNEDETGAISYVNTAYTLSDITHPGQLWYDKDGNLLGADFTAPKTSDTRPALFGVNPGRLWEFDGHIHYVLKDDKGVLSYDHYVMNPRYSAAGGDPSHPTAQQLVAMGKAKNAADVATVFEMPSLWDVIVWVKDNPSGPFAERNPLVKP